MAAAYGGHILDELLGREYVSTFPLNGLQEYGRHLLWRNVVLEVHLLDDPGAMGAA